ncbi:hypothetical protein LZ30DRAFT_725915 [Colletotrichum cereale]|nr:hypothetical protein LZ30DRAFT_725915 [Colletotrichum cereale]
MCPLTGSHWAAILLPQIELVSQLAAASLTWFPSSSVTVVAIISPIRHSTQPCVLHHASFTVLFAPALPFAGIIATSTRFPLPCATPSS